MKVALLTTATPHHVYFLSRLASDFDVVRVITETKGSVAPFETYHPFESERDEYEWHHWFNGRLRSLDEFADESLHDSCNSPQAQAELKQLEADVVVVFGTGRLRQSTIDACGSETINLHGGDPERYRGLDTHLWAIYHGDFGGLSTTLHRVNHRLDDGRIIANLPLPIQAGLKLHQLRQANTEVCVRLTLECLRYVRDTGEITSRPQSSHGRYYSFMPSVLKQICLDKFNRYTDSL